MNETAIRATIEKYRLFLCDRLTELDDAQWATPSLCAGWTVREVVAHLTLPTRATWPQVIGRAIRARGSFDRMEDRWAHDLSVAHEPAQLIARLAQTAASERRMPASGPLDPFVDVIVHIQDIARPLGANWPTELPDAVTALDYLRTNKFFGVPKRLAGLYVAASDVDWSTGNLGDPAVTGPADDLLLVAMGRPAGLRGLTGAGVSALAARIS